MVLPTWTVFPISSPASCPQAVNRRGSWKYNQTPTAPCEARGVRLFKIPGSNLEHLLMLIIELNGIRLLSLKRTEPVDFVTEWEAEAVDDLYSLCYKKWKCTEKQAALILPRTFLLQGKSTNHHPSMCPKVEPFTVEITEYDFFPHLLINASPKISIWATASAGC